MGQIQHSVGRGNKLAALVRMQIINTMLLFYKQDYMITISAITDTQYAPLLHDLLFRAFEPFRPYYTAGAFASTVAAEGVIQERIESDDYTIYVAHWSGELAGTVTTKLTDNGDLLFMSMAVLPAYAGKGIATALIRQVETEAHARQCLGILLETYLPLTQAVRLYQHCGFLTTGSKRDYFGIDIFEMRKEVANFEQFLPKTLNT